jgi:hypothetical protein
MEFTAFSILPEDIHLLFVNATFLPLTMKSFRQIGISHLAVSLNVLMITVVLIGTSGIDIDDVILERCLGLSERRH